MRIAADQNKRTLCIALYNQLLHAEGICPANHTVNYDYGWFYYDGTPFHRPDLTAKADQLLASGEFQVLYWGMGNTYVLGELSVEDYRP